MPAEMKPVHFEQIENRIYYLRDLKVMLSMDLALLYQVEPRVLIQAVKRNIDRFPDDFMFQLTQREFEELNIENKVSGRGGIRRARPYAFTEQGIAMLSTVLNSKKAIEANIQIMRVFVKMRQLIASHSELAQKIESLEGKYDHQFQVVFDALKQILAQPAKAKRKIGFKVREE